MSNGVAGSTGDSGGNAGDGRIDVGEPKNISASGGGGGGGGGFGGAATSIGTGGPGGGAGGGGAGGAQAATEEGYYIVTAYGGKGGQNGDGSYAADGRESLVSKNGVTIHTNFDSPFLDILDYGVQPSEWVVIGNGGDGGDVGSATTTGFASSITVDWTTQENDWGLICQQTQTTRADWVHLTDGSQIGKTLGRADATTYYYTALDRTFTNSNACSSGLTILGTVYLYIPSGKTITCTGANASGQTGAGAGIELTAGNTLYLIGSGKLVATGGNAANGTRGGDGGDATRNGNDIYSGGGGRGGDGGGGAGAGIGTRGGNGGNGGVGGENDTPKPGNAGSNGYDGSTAAEMGTLYIYEGSQTLTPQTDIQGGSQGTSGNGGFGGRHGLFGMIRDTDWYLIESYAGGGGGGGGGFGGAASNIGTGGPGGGGGGGGASGSTSYSWDYNFHQVGAFGGAGGVNGDGTTAHSGDDTMMKSTSDLSECVIMDDHIKRDQIANAGWQEGDNRAAGGRGGGSGASTSSTAIAVHATPATISLADHDDNSTTISNINGYLADVTLSGRTLYKDGAWNTIVLPFDVVLESSPLAGAIAQPLNEASISGTTLYLTFGEAVTELEAGTPYIIKWDAANENIVNPVFNGVIIDETTHDYDNNASDDDQRVRFLGTYKRTTFDAEDKSILFMGGANTLYYPLNGASIGAQRAYFKIGDGSSQVKQFVLNFGEDEATGIGSLTPDSSPKGEGSIYSLDGRRFHNKPAQKGVYIVNGRKVIIK